VHEERAARARFAELGHDRRLGQVEDILKTTAPILLDGREIGRLYLGLSLAELRAETARSRRTIALISLLVFVVGMAAVFAISAVIAGPLRRIMEAARRIAAGDLQQRAPTSSRDEVGELARAFNLMVNHLQNAYQELEKANQHLEQRIAERTRHLQQEIDHHRRTQEQRAALEEQLRQAQKMEAVGQLNAGIAHNFNNMLQGIMGNVELSLADAPQDLKEPLADALLSCRRAGQLVRDLMLFSRRTQVEKTSLDIGALVREVVAICRQTFDRKIHIAVNIPHSLPLVMGHAGQLHQVFLNLCINARDALEGHAGHPTLCIEILSVAASQILPPSSSAAAVSPCVCVRVADNGRGMDEGIQQRMYEPFFTTKEVGKGTGLGLSTAYAIIQDHQGWITCDSRPGRGTTFSLYLPVALDHLSGAAAERSPEAIPRSPAPQDSSATILVIDDEESICRLVERMLQPLGYAVLWATRGREGLALFQERRATIDLVILDLSMPELSGQEVLAALRAMEPQVRVLIATGHPADRVSLLAAETVLQKPFTAEALVSAVQRTLGRERSA
jgi:signal transduction histidine kinase/CheY-like chemotaxis protein